MAKQENEGKKNVVIKKYGNGGGAVYGLGLIGALVYFVSNSHTFWDGLLGILKAIVWPALLVYSLLDFLKM